MRESHRRWVRFGVVWSVFAFSATPAASQGMITAKGGLVTHIEGSLLVNAKAVKLDPARALVVNESAVVRTDGDSRAELMVVPDGYLRIAPGSEVEMLALSADTAHLRLRTGSVLLDLLDVWDEESVSLRVSDALLKIRKGGLYQAEKVPGSPVVIKNYRGKAEVAVNETDHKLRPKMQLTMAASGEALSGPFQPSENDENYAWNQARSNELELQRVEAIMAQKRGQALTSRQRQVLAGSRVWNCHLTGLCGGMGRSRGVMGGPSGGRGSPPSAPSGTPSGGGGASTARAPRSRQ